jgi:hypothetical protein
LTRKKRKKEEKDCATDHPATPVLPEQGATLLLLLLEIALPLIITSLIIHDYQARDKK